MNAPAEPPDETPAEPEAPPRRWRERLDFLELELAKASDPVQKFQLRKEIEAGRARLAELAAAGAARQPAGTLAARPRWWRRTFKTPGEAFGFKLPAFEVPLWVLVAALLLTAIPGYCLGLRPTLDQAGNGAHDALRLARYDLALSALDAVPGWLAWWPGFADLRSKALLGRDFYTNPAHREAQDAQLTRRLAAAPHDPDLLVLAATRHLARNEFDQVRTPAAAATRADPANAEGWYLLGWDRELAGETAAAIPYYKTAVDLPRVRRSTATTWPGHCWTRVRWRRRSRNTAGSAASRSPRWSRGSGTGRRGAGPRRSMPGPTRCGCWTRPRSWRTITTAAIGGFSSPTRACAWPPWRTSAAMRN